MMYGTLINNTSGYCCGVVNVKHYTSTGKWDSGYGEYPQPAITKESILKMPGARFLEGGFLTDALSNKMMAHLTELFGPPAYKSPIRKNTNTNKNNDFYVAIWELPDRKGE